MTNQAQKRPFASLMEQDYDNELNDNLSPQPSLSPIAHDTYTDDSIYTQQNNNVYIDSTHKLIDHNSYDSNNYDSLLPQNTYQQQYHQPHHFQQQPYLTNNSYQPSTPNSQPPSISLPQQQQQQSVQQQQNQQNQQNQQHTQHLTKQEQAYCIKTLTALMKHRKAIHFLQPVDVVAFNIPDYLDIVKEPMDLGTVSQKLNLHQYHTVDAFLADIELIFYNCYLYNNAQDPVSLDAKKLEDVFQKWLAKRPEPQPTLTQQQQQFTDTTTSVGTIQQQQQQQQPVFSIGGNDDGLNGNNTSMEASDIGIDEVTIMPDDQFKHCESTLKELKKSKHENLNWPFVAPVNAEAWGATDYYQIISHPMDLSTVEKKLNDYEYANENEFESDIRLIFQNCYTYNPPEHAVHQLGKKFEHVFDSFWKKVHKKSSSKAKKDLKKQNKRIKLVAHDIEAVAPATPASTVPTLKHDSVNGYTTTTTTTTATPTTTTTTTTPTNEEVRPPTILRLKLTTKPNNENKSNTPTPPSSTTPTTMTTPIQQQEPKPPKIPGLALSKEPPADSARPKLAIGNKTSPPPEKRIEKKTPIVLQNHDKWLALAQKSGSTDDFDSAMSTPSAPTNASATTTSANTSTAAPSPAKTFDITEFIDRMKHENRTRDQQKRVVEEQRKEKDRLYMEKKQQTLRQTEEQKKEHKEWMEQQKRKDRESRLASLEPHHVDISKQKMMFHHFETSSLNRDQDWRDLFIWQRDTVDYRRIPAPGFVRRGHINMNDLQRKILTKCVRLQPPADTDLKEMDMDMV